MRTKPLPDSKPEYKEFFCSKCQKYKKGSLLAYKRKNRSVCTSCTLPIKEQEQLGILSPYQNVEKGRALIKPVANPYKKPLTNSTLQAITGETHGSKKTS